MIKLETYLLFMIPKSELIGKKVSYIDDKGKYEGKFRIHKVIKITGKTLILKTSFAVNGHRFKKRNKHIHPDKNKIEGVYLRGKIVPIDWKR